MHEGGSWIEGFSSTLAFVPQDGAEMMLTLGKDDCDVEVPAWEVATEGGQLT